MFMVAHHVFYLQKALEISRTVISLRKECSCDRILSHVVLATLLEAEIIEKAVFSYALDQL